MGDGIDLGSAGGDHQGSNADLVGSVLRDYASIYTSGGYTSFFYSHARLCDAIGARAYLYLASNELLNVDSLECGLSDIVNITSLCHDGLILC